MKLLQFTKKTMMLCMCALFLLSLQFTLIFTFASKKAYASTSDLLSNPNFENSTSTSTGKPNNPSYWSAAGGDEDNVSKGVIDTENATFTKNTKYGLEENPSTHSGAVDTKILMIDSKDKYTRFGYKSSEAISFEKNSYYKLSIYCKTETLTNGASIYLTGSEKELTNQYHFVDITTNPLINSGWTNYTFYIRTNVNEGADLTLELWLGSKADNNITSNGSVFFDDIKISEIDQNLYHEYINAYDFSNEDNMPATYRNIDLTKNLYPYQFENSNFEADTLEGWDKVISGGEEGTYSGLTIADNTSEMLYDMHLEETDVIPGSTRTYGNTQALYINHTNEDGSHTEYKSTPITIKQHSFAMISVYAKTGNIAKGGAYISAQTVKEDLNSGEKEEESDVLKVTTNAFSSTSTALSAYNNYCLVNIYVEGNPYRDTEITLSLGLGSEDTKTKGYVIFDDIQVNYISYTKYKSASENVLKLYSDTDSDKISNGAFNFSSSEKAESFPVSPRNWTVSNDISGIININEANFNEKQSGTTPAYGTSAINPGPANYPGADQNIATTKQNVLMLRNDNNKSFVSATSDAFSYDISTESEDGSTTPFVAISVYVKVQENLGNETSGANISLLNDSYTIAAINNIKDTEWTKYTIYLEANISTLNLQLVLSLGSETNPTSGYAYFDFVTYTSNISEEEVTTRNTATSVYTSLSNNSFDSYITNENGVHTPTTMTSTSVSSATTAGVIDASNISTHVVNVDIPARDGSVNNNLLMIKNNAPTSYTYTTNYSYNFSAGSHYVVTVWIYTANLTSHEDVEKYGVNISMTNVEKSFSNVSSKVELDENVWTAFKFYISAQTDSSITSTLSVSLGSTDHETQGFVFVDAITVESIDATTYNEAKADDYTIKTIAEVSEPIETDPEEETDASAQGTGVNYWVLFSSIILAIALIIAIFGIAVRKLNFRLPRFNRNKKADYNRDLGLNHADVKRELAAARQAKLKELDKQITTTKDSMAKLKADYEASIKGLDNEQKIEKLFTKYAKANSKLQTEVDNFESAKKYLTDEANIKLEEQREIRKRQIMLEEENRLMKQNQAAIEKEKQKEKEAQKAKEEEGKKKARLKSKQ